MTTEQIFEDNELIANFMGYKIIKGKQNFLYKPNNDDWIIGSDDINYILNHFKYHTDWNWLMGVVEKIESIRYKLSGGDDENWFVVNISADQCSVDREIYNSSGQIIDNFMGNKSKIQRVYEVVIEFIKWYQENK